MTKLADRTQNKQVSAVADEPGDTVHHILSLLNEGGRSVC